MFQYRPVPKPNHKRLKPTAKQRGHVSTKVRKQLYERSGGFCERCGRYGGLQAAHITRRWKLDKTTVDDLLHLCVECHIWADNTAEGREWLRSKEGGG